MQINAHACNVCMDCTKVCSHNAIAYRPDPGCRREPAPRPAQGPLHGPPHIQVGGITCYTD